MLVAALTLALFGFVMALVTDIIRHDGRKIMAALQGRSWAAEPTAGRPMTIRFSQPYRAAKPAPKWPALRAAA